MARFRHREEEIAGLRFGCVLTDAGYGSSPDFRRGLDARGLAWAAGVACTQLVYPATVRLRPSLTPTGRPAKHPVPSRPPGSAAAMLERQRWRRIAWRNGTKGPLGARFAALRVRVADGPRNADSTRLPGEAVWLIGEWRDNGERKYYLSNLPPRTSLRRLAATVKARWSCEQAHQHLKQELGLGDFEVRAKAAGYAEEVQLNRLGADHAGGDIEITLALHEDAPVAPAGDAGGAAMSSDAH